MQTSTVLLRVTQLALFLSALCEVRAAVAEEKPGNVTSRTSVDGFFKNHCFRCHAGEKAKGGLSLDALKGEITGDAKVEQWALVLQMLETEAMPPADEPQPSAAERQAAALWIHNALRELAQRERERGGKRDSVTNSAATTRRLTNAEYHNTMRDLLGFELKLTDNLPKDPTKPYHFNNTAEFMRIGPEQIDRYLECARQAMASAIVDPEKPTPTKIRREWKPDKPDNTGNGLGLNEVGIWGNRRYSAAEGIAISKFPATGEFRVRFKAAAILPEGYAELPLRLVMGYGLNVNLSTQRIEPIGTVRLRNPPDQSEEFEFRGRIENFPPEPAKGGTQRLVITPQNLFDDGTLNDHNIFQKPRNLTMPRAVIEWLEFEAPLTETWPPEHHTRILFDSPLRAENPDAYIRAVLQRFMSRAYRRPATDDEVSRFAKIYATLLPELKTIEAAMRETLALVLVSPQFLYHAVSDTPAKGKQSTQFALASRLSYFLWNSMPDDQLLQLAGEGKLNTPESIKQQALRMIDDKRASDFVRNFTLQWLSIEKMRTVPINRDLFPRFLFYVPLGERAGTEEPYRPTIRDFMIDETVGFIQELIRRNAPVANIVDSDFAYLNLPLASHYGVPGVHGDELRPVPLKPEYNLGGLLTHGSVLIGNGTGTAPHPIYRAVWLREAILGDDVPPPPAEVPALVDSAGEAALKALSIKKLLEQHRKVESCKVCHYRLDPWGIPFEQYNAIGKFQDLVPKQGTRVRPFELATHKDLSGYEAYLKSINTVAVEADSQIPSGHVVNGMRELKAYLLEHRQDDIAKNILRRLLTYGIGRELSWRDRFAVEELLRQTQKNNYRLRDMIVAICLSDTFLQGQ